MTAEVVSFRHPSIGDTGDFFAVDRRAWAVACEGGINVAVAYLIVSRGTLRDMRTSAWSVNAIEQRTHMGRHRAKEAIQKLEAVGLVRKTKGGSRPQYFVQPAHEVVGSEAYPRDPLSDLGAKVMRHVEAKQGSLPNRATKDWDYQNPRSVAGDLVAARYLRDRGGGHFEAAPFDEAASRLPDWIWLPNALTDGAGSEAAPIELVRQSQNVGALRLLVDLYHSQSLARDGGVHWRQLRQPYDRTRYGEAGQFVVWGFTPGTAMAWQDAPFISPFMTGDAASGTDPGWQAFWAALAILRSLGLAEYVGHVIEADTQEAAVVHPYAMSGGERAEQALARSAHRAGAALLNAYGREQASEAGAWLLPAFKHQEKIQIVGILRLRYRARTAATALWYEGADAWREWTHRYAAIEAQSNNGAVHATLTGDQWVINGGSTTR